MLLDQICYNIQTGTHLVQDSPYFSTQGHTYYILQEKERKRVNRKHMEQQELSKKCDQRKKNP